MVKNYKIRKPNIEIRNKFNAARLLPNLLAVSIFFTASQFLLVPMALADDVGITKARLIQKSEKSYVLEADVTQVLVWAIKTPIFPDRFQVSELEYINQTGWIVVQATATTTGDPLSPQDEILLPWMRNGAAITAQWLDGSVYKSHSDLMGAVTGMEVKTLEGRPLMYQGMSDTFLGPTDDVPMASEDYGIDFKRRWHGAFFILQDSVGRVDC